MKMRTRIILTLLVAVQMSVALCEKNFFYEQFFSKHHRGHSTTEAISSSTPGYSTSEAISSSTRDISSEEELESSSSDFVVTSKQTTSVLKSPDYYERPGISSVAIGLIVGCVVSFLCALICIFCCLRYFCRRKERPGFVINNQTDSGAGVNSQQAMMIQQQQLSAAMQHNPPDYPNEHTQLFIPPFQHRPVPNQYPPVQSQYPHAQTQFQPQYPPAHPEFQYSPDGMQYHNPPEAPPPYEFPEKF